MDQDESKLLTPETVGPYLVARGLVDGQAKIMAVELGWGVSNVVLAVEGDGFRAVVKQALPRLRVAEEWTAKRQRALTEAEALRFVDGIRPSFVPAVLDVDADACAIVIARAPSSWRNWKEILISGDADPTVAQRLGELLGSWHRETEDDPKIAERFGDTEAFVQLRIDPYHRTVMRRWPNLGRAIGSFVEEMLDTRRCLVHGDFSPKNVLLGEDGLWVLDFEVAHNGDPVFDLAFMLNHLMLKAIHRPANLQDYRACADTFLASYGREAEPEYLLGHVGCLMLARVDGKSPAEYLREPERLQARAFGAHLVLDPPGSPEKAWVLLHEVIR